MNWGIAECPHILPRNGFNTAIRPTSANFAKEVMFLPLLVCLSVTQKVVDEFW